MTWTLCPFWPGCGAAIERGCEDCNDEREEAYWENLSEDEWKDFAEEDDEELAGGDERAIFRREIGET